MKETDAGQIPTLVVEATLVPTLPEPWIFDGYRRVYDDLKPTGQWSARAINPRSAEAEKGTGRTVVSYLAGTGPTLMEARNALLDLLRAERL